MLKRVRTFSIEEVEDIVKEDVVNSKCGGFEKHSSKDIMIDGLKVRTISMRYKTFIEKGYVCAKCGRKGAYYALEYHTPNNSKRAHFNLYSEDGMLMTKDHIVPRSKGGSNGIENMQTMCQLCNSVKGNSEE